MVDAETFRQMALSFPEAVEQDHWGNPSFRVKKRIFATLQIEEKESVLKLSLIAQSIFVDFDKTVFYPVSGGWGKQGWTKVELSKVNKSMLKDAMTKAYCAVAPKKLVAKFIEGEG